MAALPEQFQWDEGRPVGGVEMATARAGYKYAGRDDLLLVRLPEGTSVAGVTTRSACVSPEVEWCRERLAAGGPARALVVSSGNSNAFTGAEGREAAASIARGAADALGIAESEVMLSATGVIGEPLPAAKGVAVLPAASARLSGDVDWTAAANTIGTTDTFPKIASAAALIGGETVTVTGIAKGSGMIAPDMATMLAYLFTDAAVDRTLLQDMIASANARSFNAITVDSDTSTSDTCLIFATGGAGTATLASPSDPGADALQAAITDVCTRLAQLIVRDGEGAEKFITVDVTGAQSDASAHRVALSIANSPLVKTAIAGEDANWGRVVMAVGKAGEPADRDRLSIRFGSTVVAREGRRVPDYDEAPVARHLKEIDVEVGVDLGLGDGRARVWTCDLTHGYISINADYRS